MEAVIPVLRVRGLGAGDRKEQAHGTWENVKKKKKRTLNCPISATNFE